MPLFFATSFSSSIDRFIMLILVCDFFLYLFLLLRYGLLFSLNNNNNNNNNNNDSNNDK